MKSKKKLSTLLLCKWIELPFFMLYAIGFYVVIIHQSLQLSHDHYFKLHGLRPGWLAGRLNDASDSQWRNFRGNLPILTTVFGTFALVANTLRTYFQLKARGMSYVWLFISLIYLFYLHGACVIFILAIASLNYLLVKLDEQKLGHSDIPFRSICFFFAIEFPENRICASRLGSLPIDEKLPMKSKKKLSTLLLCKWIELPFLMLYAIGFYVVIIRQSLQLSHDHYFKLHGLRPGWLAGQLNDASDSQWRNFRGNLPILTTVFGTFALVANTLRTYFQLKARGMSYVWLFISLIYLFYLHGACVIFILAIASLNYLLVKIFAQMKHFMVVLWIFNVLFLISNRVYEGYSFSMFGGRWSYLDNFRGTFRWQICFNFVVLRMISFGYDYFWASNGSRFDYEKHVERCYICKSGKTCYQLLQGKSVQSDKFSFSIYLSYLIYAPLYIAGPIVSFNAFASQLETPQRNYSVKDIVLYGCRWLFSLSLMEVMTHFLYYNAFANSGLWRQLSPMDVFIIGYGVLNFMWLKFFLIWRYFRLWSLICGIEVPENMPKCINNCHDLEGFWKSWHASYNKWLVRYLYIPLGGTQRKLLNVWVVFTFVALWHDLEWKLFSWAWLTCLFFVPEMLMKSAVNAFQVESTLGEVIFREVRAVASSITITCLMVANLVGFVVGPSGISWLVNRFMHREGLPVVSGMLLTFYVGAKLMFHIEESKQHRRS